MKGGRKDLPMPTLGIDLGGTFARAAVVDGAGKMLASAKVALAERSPAGVVETIVLVIVGPPVGGLFTVTDALSVAVPPIGRSPVQVTDPSGLNVRSPEVVVPSPL